MGMIRQFAWNAAAGCRACPMADAKRGPGRPVCPVYRFFDRYPTNTRADCRECKKPVMSSLMQHCIWHALSECDAISLRVTRTLLENALKPGGLQCGRVIATPILNFLQSYNVGIEAQNAINDMRLPVRERAGIALPVELRVICSIHFAEDVP